MGPSRRRAQDETGAPHAGAARMRRSNPLICHKSVCRGCEVRCSSATHRPPLSFSLCQRARTRASRRVASSRRRAYEVAARKLRPVLIKGSPLDFDSAS